MVVLAVVCGILGALGAVSFRFMIRFVQAASFEGGGSLAQVVAQGLFVHTSDPLAVARELPWAWRVAIPAAGGLVAGPIIYLFAREAKGHGVPEVMAAIALRGGVMRLRVVVVKAIASAVSIGSGGSVGREGPIVQIGSAMGSTIGQWIRVPPAQLRTLVGCGSAAGISATFNAPIAGALFATEVVVGNFAVAQLSPIVISSVVATVVARIFLGNHPAFTVPSYHLVSPFELAPYMAVGFIAGFVGLAFTLALYRTEDLFDRSPFPEWLRPAVGGSLVGVLGIGFPQVFGVGYSTIGDTLGGDVPVLLLGALVVAKILATSITIGSGGSGGIFAPSLFMGAATGSLFGGFVHQWFPGATASSGAYALVTMGAVVAATTHAPITSIIIIFELTQKITIIPPLMVACVISTLVATYMNRDSIYTMKLTRRGIDLYEEEPRNVLRSLYVHQVVDRSPEMLPASATFREVIERALASEHTDFFVVDRRNRLLGAFHLRDLTRMLSDQEALMPIVVAGDLADPAPPTVLDSDDLHLAMQVFGTITGEEVAVVDENEPRRLVGSIHKRAVLAAYNEELLRRDLAGSVSSQMIVASRGPQVELGGGFVLQEILAPPRFFGHSIRDLDLGARTGVHVVLLRKRAEADDRSRVCVPDAEDVIEEGDRLVVSGTKAAVEALGGI